MNDVSTPSGSSAFQANAPGYAETMAPSLRAVAAEVVRRARLQAGECVLDVGSGTGIAAAAALSDGRTVMGVDGAAAMLEIARREVPGAMFEVMDFHHLAFNEGAWDAVISSHALLFADDPVAALREWRRVVRREGRISLSVPGPGGLTPSALYGAIYERWGISRGLDYPTEARLAEWGAAAGWGELDVAADPDMAIHLPDAAAFAVWRNTGSRAGVTAGFSAEQHAALTVEMLAITPREPDGSLRSPFGALYLAAVNPG